MKCPCPIQRTLESYEVENNAYFYAWMKSGADEAKLLCAYCAAHPTRIVYGEWMGRDRFIGAFKGYDKAALGKLFIFDVYDTAEERFLGEPEWRDELSASGLEPYFIKLLAQNDGHVHIDVLEGPPHRVPQLGEAHEEPDGGLRQTRGALQRTSQGARKGKWAIARVCNRGSHMRHLGRYLPLFHLDVLSTTSKDTKSPLSRALEFEWRDVRDLNSRPPT